MHRRRPRSARRFATLAVTLGAVLSLVAVGVSAAAPEKKAPPKPKPRPSYSMRVAIGSQPVAGAKTIPGNFVGLSFEAAQLDSPEIEPATGNLGALLKSIGPGVVRFGGDSVENVWYDDGYSTPPTWAISRVTDDDFAALEDLLTVSGWKVELAVEAVHNDPVNAAAFVAAAAQHLGSNLIGVEIGNESDVYIKSYDDYETLYNNYAQAIHALVPGMPIIGPNTGNPQWLSAYAASGNASATQPVTEHEYALSRCGGVAPTISDLLSQSTLDVETYFLMNGLTPSVANNVPLRIDESNSVACSGQKGVSNVLASALWGTDYLLRLAQAGVAGVNLHSGLGSCTGPNYTALCQKLAGDHEQNIERATPLWYAMLLVYGLRNNTFLPVTVSEPNNHLVTAYALKDPAGNYKVVLDNMDYQRGAIDAKVSLRVPSGMRSGVVTRLAGTNVGSSDNVSLGNAAVTKAGTWRATGPTEYASGDKGSFSVTVKAGSVALVTFSKKLPPKPKKPAKKVTATKS